MFYFKNILIKQNKNTIVRDVNNVLELNVSYKFTCFMSMKYPYLFSVQNVML